MNNQYFKKLLSYFLQGLWFIIPIAATIYVLYKTFYFIDTLIPFDIPGLGLVVVVVGVTFVGYLSRFYFANPLLIYLEKLIERTPLVKIIYSSVKDLISAFVGEKKRFSEPVLVTTNLQPLIQRFGFITQTDLSELGIKSGQVAVYLPFSYGMNGMLLVVGRYRSGRRCICVQTRSRTALRARSPGRRRRGPPPPRRRAGRSRPCARRWRGSRPRARRVSARRPA